MENTLSLLFMFFIGVLASLINIMAGGGSILTLGTMMLIGLDAPVANGTNRIGLLIESVSGALAYASENVGNLKESLTLGFWALPGALIGVMFAINISNTAFQRILAVVMICVVMTLIIPQGSSIKRKNTPGKNKIFIYPIMFLIGLYGGFIQAGVGFLIMGSLRYLLHLDLVTINKHKVYIVLVYTIPTLFIFGFTQNIHWPYAVCLAAGNAAGAWLSVKISVKKGENAVKIGLSIAILLMAIKFFFTF